MQVVWRIVCCWLCLSFSCVAVGDVVSNNHHKKGQYAMDVQVTVIGAELAARELAGAMDRFSSSMLKLSESDKLSTKDKEQLIEVIAAFKQAAEKVSTTIEHGKNPLKGVVDQSKSAISSSIKESKENLLDPLLLKFEVIFWLLVGLVFFLVISSFAYMYLNHKNMKALLEKVG